MEKIQTVPQPSAGIISGRRSSPRRFRTSHETTRFVNWIFCGIILAKTLQDFSNSLLALQVGLIALSLSPNGDGHIFFSYNITTSSNIQVMRVKEMMIKDVMSQCLIKSFQLVTLKIYREKSVYYWGLKG